MDIHCVLRHGQPPIFGQFVVHDISELAPSLDPDGEMLKCKCGSKNKNCANNAEEMQDNLTDPSYLMPSQELMRKVRAMIRKWSRESNVSTSRALIVASFVY